MPNYCVNENEQPDSGDHEVHDLATTKGCLPEPENQLALGWHCPRIILAPNYRNATPTHALATTLSATYRRAPCSIPDSPTRRRPRRPLCAGQ